MGFVEGMQMADPFNKDACDSDEALDTRIDEMIEQWEKSGQTYDQCSKAMQLGIDRAKQPVTIPEWIEVAKRDSAGRRKYSDDLFEPEAVKSVVLDLLKKKQVMRLGRQTFCSKVVVGEMADAIDNIMMWECAICDLEELAELLTNYGDLENPQPQVKKGRAVSPNVNRKIKSFVEEQIVTKAMDTLESLVVIGNGEFVHYTTLETCCHYTQEAMCGRHWQAVPKNEFFSRVCGVNFTGMDNQYQGRSIRRIKECLEHPAIREFVLQTLEKESYITLDGDKVAPYKKPDGFLWLDD